MWFALFEKVMIYYFRNLQTPKEHGRISFHVPY